VLAVMLGLLPLVQTTLLLHYGLLQGS
jgi:hypothetical protein